MSNTKRKFIESHWVTFALKGAISIVAGLCITFVRKNDITFMTEILAWTMFGLALIEVLNVIYRRRKSHNWGFPLALGLFEAAIAVGLLFTINSTKPAEDLFTIRIILLSSYVAIASFTTIMMGFASFNDYTNRFMWVVNGVIGAIIAAMMFGGTDLGSVAHIELFGTYLLVNGLTDFYYGIHAKDQKVEATTVRKLSAKRGKK